MINLDTLKEALAPLAKIGKEELTFEVEGTVVHLAPLLPHQEVEVQRYSSLVLEDTQDLEGKDLDRSQYDFLKPHLRLEGATPQIRFFWMGIRAPLPGE